MSSLDETSSSNSSSSNPGNIPSSTSSVFSSISSPGNRSSKESSSSNPGRVTFSSSFSTIFFGLPLFPLAFNSSSSTTFFGLPLPFFSSISSSSISSLSKVTFETMSSNDVGFFFMLLSFGLATVFSLFTSNFDAFSIFFTTFFLSVF